MHLDQVLRKMAIEDLEDTIHKSSLRSEESCCEMSELFDWHCCSTTPEWSSAPSDTAETHQFGAETAELPMQEEERVTIAFAESIAQHIEQILELENLEDVYNSKITLHPNQMYI
ncbi:unnamed protein product [Brassica napus]|uniref:(rape) hypothetical protein n=1 Tax=Brassica napus TaxID=3708 RepID=A0A816RG76_BRANA|nr:unnamed protein product [Brassica napus]